MLSADLKVETSTVKKAFNKGYQVWDLLKYKLKCPWSFMKLFFV